MKVVLQDGMKDCGICCLLSIIRFYGGDVSKEYLRELTSTTKEGVTLYNLRNAARNIGFDAEGLSGSIEQIEVNNLPCIAHLHINKKIKHFIVIYKIDKKERKLVIMDPSKGKKVLSFSEYNLMTSKNYLFLKPQKPLPIMKKRNYILRKIVHLIQNNKKNLITLNILTINYFILSILSSFHFKYILEYSINNNVSNNVSIISQIILIVYILKNLTNYLKNIIFYKWNSLLNIELTTFTYEQVLLLPYLYFKNRTTGEILSRFKDLNTIREYLSYLFCTITIDIPSIILFTIIMFYKSKKLTITIYSMMFVVFICMMGNNPIKRKKAKQLKGKEDTINSYIVQGISNVDTIKGSHLEKRFIDKFELNYKSYQESMYQYEKQIEIENTLKENSKSILLVLFYYLGSISIVENELTLSNIIAFQSLLSYFSSSLNSIFYSISNYHSYKIALDRVEDLFLLEKENFKNHYFYLPYQLKGTIEFHHLNYSYGSKLLMNNLDLRIELGEKILLSGESGSGKSTLVKMLMRYIETKYSEIKIDGIDINHYHIQNIRENIVYVTSHEYLFHDTVQNNIT